MICTLPDCSKNLKYAIEHGSIFDVFRYGSTAWVELVREARAAYVAGHLDDLVEEDFDLLESNIGEAILIDGREYSQDLPVRIPGQPDLMEVVTYTNDQWQILRLPANFLFYK